jgi:peptidoglycan L-alanyl-D-glutamate endopeptidase CwlK
MPSRRIQDLHPTLQPIAREFLAECERQGIIVSIYCTYRSDDEQAYEYSRGRTISSGIGVTPERPLGRIVTRAKPGQSAHNFKIGAAPAAKAFDCVPLRDGKSVWGTKGDGIDDDPTDDHADDLELWQRVGEIGMKLGLNWYGRPDAPFREFPHFELKE